ncbi:MAG TPA: type I DNA topoisomerase, partial [Anaerolineae bacterium]|nr:type I DNA topoisomerase [Anaerolineae bacterium]
HAFAHPRDIDRLRVDAQQARRILDRVVGYTLSPLLRQKLSRKGLSAGRVQSVALRLVCEREREIQAFVPVEYWSIEAELKKQEAGGKRQEAGGRRQEAGSRSFWAKLVKVRGKEPDLKTGEEAQAIVDDLEGAVYRVQKVTRRERKRRPAPPFTTSTMQQEASRRLRFTAKKTMALAQALYAGKEIGGERVGLITYMRTDSVAVAESAQQEARRLILDRFGEPYLPPRPPRYKTKTKGAQEAHEAIRPTSVRRDPASLKPYLSRDEHRLYTLIWKRFLASQMAPAVLDQTSVDIAAGSASSKPALQRGPAADGAEAAPAPEPPYLFRASGSVIKFPGFLKVYEEAKEEEEAGDKKSVRLPPLTQGEILDLLQLLPKQHFTQPPPRYSDATLIRALEEYGIGRPSTYAPTLSTLLQRHYVVREQKKLRPTELGFIVNDLLVAHFADIINIGFTAEMEEKLDQVATGEQAWVPMLREFYAPFARLVEEARLHMPQVDLKPEPTGEMCPECGQPLVIRLGRYGKFIGCSGWPKCRYTQPLPVPGVVCPRCGGAVVEKRTKKGRKFYGCINYPTCDWAAWKLPRPAADKK